jgi:hypothetical protein
MTEQDGRNVPGTSALDADLMTFLSFDVPDSQAGFVGERGSAWMQAVAVCDELRQRSLSQRDVVDVALLLHSTREDAEPWIEALRHYRLTAQWNLVRRRLMTIPASKHAPPAFTAVRTTLDFAHLQLDGIRRRLASGVDCASWRMEGAAARAGLQCVSNVLYRAANAFAIGAMRLGMVYPMRFVSAAERSESMCVALDSTGLFATTPIGRFSIAK